MYRQRFAIGLSLLSILVLVGCGGAAMPTDGGTSSDAAAPSVLQVSADASGLLKFQPETLEAPAGKPIRVMFSNPAPLQHNWVLVGAGQEQAVVDAAAGKSGDATGVSGVLATTALLNAKAEETKDVPAQSAGTYSYICTVPGHYAAGMRGTLTLK